MVICPANNTIFHLDSARSTKKYLVMSVLQNIMKKIHGRAPRGPTWKSPMCPQQDNGVDCGLYVMRFMLDIATHCSNTIHLDEFCKVQKGDPLTSKELNEVRDMLASFITFNL
ncbi:uncharacterized protein LOC110702385 [Chenopodium quinoa]|uniref:uncharacterized protein LOC110702385 n=1 Tax=Chenopodium quinoa TaxID=63459 RepID=UPI000B785F55|nr:uncharacterized protein LOC110702385 [Chenopodium quinoa]